MSRFNDHQWLPKSHQSSQSPWGNPLTIEGSQAIESFQQWTMASLRAVITSFLQAKRLLNHRRGTMKTCLSYRAATLTVATLTSNGRQGSIGLSQLSRGWTACCTSSLRRHHSLLANKKRSIRAESSSKTHPGIAVRHPQRSNWKASTARVKLRTRAASYTPPLNPLNSSTSMTKVKIHPTTATSHWVRHSQEQSKQQSLWWSTKAS